MKKLNELTTSDLGGGIAVIDLGASGGVQPQWRPIAKWINLIGFDPNAAECARLNSLPSGYLSARFFPYALAGETGRRELYKTKSIYCWSLLKPRMEWLSRFTYSDLFEPAGTEPLEVYRLDEVRELEGVEVDAMKIDTQGVELPILKGAMPAVETSICIETETGLTQNYAGETTFDEMLGFMDGLGFGLFGIDTNHAIARKNRLSGVSQNEQILWCEAVWMRDYYKASPEQQGRLTREKALRALCLYANHGCLSFGLEAAALFRDLGLMTGAEYDAMAGDESWWRLPRRGTAWKKMARLALDYVPRKSLGRFRHGLSSLMAAIDDVSVTPHPLKRRWKTGE